MTPWKMGMVLPGFGKLKPIPTPVHTHDTLSRVYPYPCHALFAKETGQKLQWYYAKDKCQQKLVTDRNLRDYLSHLPSGQTQQCLGHIPLILGMPILISQNFNMEGGVVNRSRGTVSHICYHIDEHGYHHLLSVIIHISDSSEELLGNLPPHDLPILADTTDITF